MTLDVHAVLRAADAAKAARAEQLPDVNECLRVLQQVNLRLLELGWKSITYVPSNGGTAHAIHAIAPGCTAVLSVINLSNDPMQKNWFAEDSGDWWPCRPIWWKEKEKS